MASTTNVSLQKKVLNNYHEMRNVLKEKLNNDKIDLMS